jgi:sugar lactone lactonase YvrE
MKKSIRLFLGQHEIRAHLRLVSPWLQIAIVFAVAFLALSSPTRMLAQGTNESSVLVQLTPSGANGNIAFYEAVSAVALVRDYNDNGIAGATVTFTVDGANSKTAITDSTGAAYINLGQQSIATHKVTASFAGNTSFAASNQSQSFEVFDSFFQFVGTQGTTLFVDGSVLGVQGVAVDVQDNLYITDSSLNFVKKEDALGNVTTIPFSGLKGPIGIALDTPGNLFVADTGNNRVLEYDTSGHQTVLNITGLNGPTYLAYDRDDDLLFVADPNNQRVVYYDPSKKTTTVAASGITGLRNIAIGPYDSLLYADQDTGFWEVGGYVAGNTAKRPLFAPVTEAGGIAAGPNNSIFLSDQATNNIFNYDAFGNQIQINQAGSPAEGMAVDSKGRVYLALGGRVDVIAQGSGRVPDVGVSVSSPFFLIFQQSKAEPSFNLTAAPATLFNNERTGGCNAPTNSCFDVVYFDPQVAGVNSGSFTASIGSNSVTEELWGNGIGAQGAFSPGVFSQNTSNAGSIGGLAYDLAGNSYVADTKNNSVGETTTAYATSTLKFTGLSSPTQLAVDGAGSVYVLDSGNQRIEKLDTAGNQTDAYAPSGEGISVVPSAFTVDGEGNLVVAGLGGGEPDAKGNNARGKEAKAKRVATSPEASPEASGNYSIYYIGANDGFKLPFPGPSFIAQDLPDISAVAIDSAGNIYAADTTGSLTRFAPDGTSKSLASGLGTPVAISVDAAQTVYVAEANSGTLHLVHSNGTTDTLAIPSLSDPASLAMNGYGNILTGDVTSHQFLYLDRTKQDYGFGSVPVGTPSTLHGTLSNIGNQSFSIEGVNAGTIPHDANFVEVSSTTECSQGDTGESKNSTLAPFASCDLSYTFNPPSAGMFTNSGHIPTSPAIFTGTPGGGLISLSGTGTGASSGALTISPTKIVFPDTAVGSKSVTMTATLSNTKPVGVYLGKGSLTDGTDFTQTDNCFSFLNAGNGTCTVTFTFTPKSSGPLTSTYTIYDLDDASDTLTVVLSGNGTSSTAPQAALSPTTASFGSVTIGDSSSAQTFTLTNAGTAALPITSVKLSGTNAASFSITANACGSSLAAGKACTVSVNFSPTTAASDSATLSVVDSVGTQTSALTGTGTAAAAPKAALTPTSADFGSEDIGSTSSGKAFTLTNAGTASLPITSISITGANIYSFALSNNTCKSPLAAGASCTITISFAPTATGSASATLTVIDSVGTQTSALTGTGVSAPATPPAATLTPSTLDFGSVQTGVTSAAKTATLTSTGTAALAITSIQVTGANAAVFASTNTCGSSLAIGASCTISVTFAPTATGSETASITVTDNAAGSPQTVALSGTATAPPVAADFTIAATPSTQSVTAGASANYAINLASTGSTFTNAVALSVTGLPTGATATFTPTSVTPGADGASSAMSIQTVAAQSTQQARQTPGKSPWPTTAAIVSTALLILPFRKRKRFASLLTCLGLLVLTLTSLTACGGGFALPKQPQPPATYTLTVTGTSGSMQHSTTVQITVR